MSSSADHPAQRADREADSARDAEQEQIPSIDWIDRIPNPSVREMARRREEAGLRVPTIRAPEWAGYYFQSSSAGRIHPFLTIGDLPPEWCYRYSPNYDLIACAGSLLLLKADHSELQQTPPATTWEPLLVCNAVTNERRELPRPGCMEFSSWDYDGLEADMIAHSDLSYNVILTFTTVLCVYKSTSNTWRCLRFPQPAPWGRDVENRGPCRWVSAHAFKGGRFYFADVKPEPGDSPAARCTLRTFAIDEEAGTWTLYNSWSLRKWPFNFLSSRLIWDSSIGRELDVVLSMELLECIGEMYAVVPTRIDELLSTDFTNFRTRDELHRHPLKGFVFMPAHSVSYSATAAGWR